ncbi:topoisomerase IV [Burkholderia ubonensis]|uniref:Topoisomerase IV n=1 Tax=Burkholderia ubonensis subsp. mesacidophila TaxID=265293 RepID=A0A2A4EVG8_9BURK|nr:topoisomerase IV [Burkholderia ubonensis]PCE24314.1 topoisomerase IV [Burkholderia ubonensis subsp. mesacidophila]
MNSTFRRVSRLLTLAGCGLCAALPAQAAQAADAPPADRLLQGFIRDTYVKWRADRNGWQPVDGDNIYEPCASLRVTTSDGPRYLLAMCGATAASVQNGTPRMGSQGDSGSVDLYVLKPVRGGKSLAPVMKKTGIDSGNYGEPGTVSIQRLGPHLFGFVLNDGVTLQGYSVSMRSIWLPRDNAFVLAAPRINEALDNSASNDCATAKAHCEERRFAIAPDTSGSDEVYPLTVTETGWRGNREIHARYTVKFDGARGRYVVPKALREGY